MYPKKVEFHQKSFFDFNQSCGIALDEKNEWIQLAHAIDWDRLEEESGYSNFFSTRKGQYQGRPAKSFRLVFGICIIKQRLNLTDREVIKQVMENPYLQYFIGYKQFSNIQPMAASGLVAVRKHLSVGLLSRLNEILIETAASTKEHQDGKDNVLTAILDATCSPSNIRYPQDFSLTNEARTKLEEIIDRLVKDNHGFTKPRMYRKIARKEFLHLSKSKKRTKKAIRSYLRKDLTRIQRDLKYIEDFVSKGASLSEKEIQTIKTTRELHAQQLEMYREKKHSVKDRIVSVSQPYIRPIVRGKAKSPVEFGAKYQVSVDEKGHARLDAISFDAFNESTFLQASIEKYKERMGVYPTRVLVDQIYRTRENIRFCSERGIDISGPKLGRPDSNTDDKKKRRQDEIDRIEVERFFSKSKRTCGAGLIRTRLEDTTLSTIMMSILVANLFSIPWPSFFCLVFVGSQSDTYSYDFFQFVS